MKKISLLLALCMLLTVGGVYAVWTYSDGAIEQASDEQIMELSGLGSSTPHGSYAVDATGLTMVIDPASQTNPLRPNDVHVTTLTVTGQIVLTFTPNLNASSHIKENGPESVYEIRLTNNSWTFDDKQGHSGNIVTLVDVGHDHTISWNDDDEDGVFTFVIDAAEFAQHIDLTEFTLDTLSDYNDFKDALSQGKIEIVVSDKPNP